MKKFISQIKEAVTSITTVTTSNGNGASNMRTPTLWYKSGNQIYVKLESDDQFYYQVTNGKLSNRTYRQLPTGAKKIQPQGQVEV